MLLLLLNLIYFFLVCIYHRLQGLQTLWWMDTRTRLMYLWDRGRHRRRNMGRGIFSQFVSERKEILLWACLSKRGLFSDWTSLLGRHLSHRAPSCRRHLPQWTCPVERPLDHWNISLWRPLSRRAILESRPLPHWAHLGCWLLSNWAIFMRNWRRYWQQTCTRLGNYRVRNY